VLFQRIDGKLVVIGNVPTPGTELEKSLSSANFQALRVRPAPAQPVVGTQAPADSASASTGASAKP
jgi:hypothetical protein